MQARGIQVRRSYVGEYCTSLEMAGASLTLVKLDDELYGPADGPGRNPLPGVLNPPDFSVCGDAALCHLGSHGSDRKFELDRFPRSVLRLSDVPGTAMELPATQLALLHRISNMVSSGARWMRSWAKLWGLRRR